MRESKLDSRHSLSYPSQIKLIQTMANSFSKILINPSSLNYSGLTRQREPCPSSNPPPTTARSNHARITIQLSLSFSLLIDLQLNILLTISISAHREKKQYDKLHRQARYKTRSILIKPSFLPSFLASQNDPREKSKFGAKREKGRKKRGRSKAREEDRKALESVGSMVNPSPWFSWPIGNRARGPSRANARLRRLQWRYFTGRVAERGNAWPLAVRSGVCVCVWKEAQVSPCASDWLDGEGGIKLPFVNIERDLTTPRRLLLLLHRIKMDPAKTRFSRRETLIMGEMARWCALVKGIRCLQEMYADV